MDLRRRYEYGRVFFNQFFFIKIIVQTAQACQFSRNSTFIIGVLHTIFYIIFEIGEVFLNIQCRHLIQQRKRIFRNDHFSIHRIVIMNIFKKNAEIIRIGQSGSRGSCRFNSHKIFPAEFWQKRQLLPQPDSICYVYFFMISFFFHSVTSLLFFSDRLDHILFAFLKKNIYTDIC